MSKVIKRYSIFIFIVCMTNILVQAMELNTCAQGNEWQKDASKLIDAYRKGTASTWYKKAKNSIAREIGYSPLKKLKTIVAQQDSTEAIIFLAEHGSSYKPAVNALHRAATNGYAAFCIFLIETQLAQVSDLDHKQNTPLHSAALAGQAAICTLLLQYGAAHFAKNDRGLTPLQKLLLFGQENSKKRCIPLLVQHGARFDIFNHIDLWPNTIYVRLLDLNPQSLKTYFSWGLYKERYQYNNTLFHQLACQKHLVKASLWLLYAMVFNRGLEQEKKLACTLLALRKFRASGLKIIPCDVIKTCILPDMMPFKYRGAACIELQLKLLQLELLQTNELHKIPLDYVSDNKQEQFKIYFNHDTIESHRDGLAYFLMKTVFHSQEGTI